MTPITKVVAFRRALPVVRKGMSDRCARTLQRLIKLTTAASVSFGTFSGTVHLLVDPLIASVVTILGVVCAAPLVSASSTKAGSGFVSAN